jgi:hypothetical protein
MNARRTTIGIGMAALLAAGACVQSAPRRVAGSDLTLPESGERTFLRSLLTPCDQPDTLNVGSSRRAAASRCGTSADTVRSPADPVVPPRQKTP